MKKLVLGIVLFFFASISNVDAANINATVITNKSNYIVGETVRVTLRFQTSSDIAIAQYRVNYDSNRLKHTSGELSNIVYTDKNGIKTIEENLQFQVTNSGDARISINELVVYDSKENLLTNRITNRTISSMTQAQLEATFSRNNYLSSLTVEGAELSPRFNRDETEYEVILEPETEEVTISGSREDNSASVDGFGTFEVNDGSNQFEIVVSAQNGNIRTYTLNVIVEELDPINVSIDSKDYTIVRKEEDISCFSSFELTQMDFEDEEIPVCYNEKSDLTLISLRDEDGESYFYEYDGEFKKFVKLATEAIIFYYKDFPDNVDIPSNFSLNKRKINGVEYDFYINRDNRDFGLMYGVNVLTGEEGIYQYDFKENTIQRYYEVEVEEVDNTPIMIAIASLLAVSSGFNVYFVTKDIKKGEKKNWFRKKKQ